MKERITNPLFLAASVSFLYNVTNYITKQFFGVVIDPNAWLTFFNLLLWVILGVGVYASYVPSQSNPLAQPIQTQPAIIPQATTVNTPVAQTGTYNQADHQPIVPETVVGEPQQVNQ